MPYSLRENREHFWVLLLNTKSHIICMKEISVGSLSAAVVHPREVFEMAVKHHAASMILIHNHPSGDPTPSREDIAITERLVKAGKIMDIPVLDHVILGNNRYASLKKKGLMGR
jgi:DNA repair protein RadC